MEEEEGREEVTVQDRGEQVGTVATGQAAEQVGHGGRAEEVVRAEQGGGSEHVSADDTSSRESRPSRRAAVVSPGGRQLSR